MEESLMGVFSELQDRDPEVNCAIVLRLRLIFHEEKWHGPYPFQVIKVPFSQVKKTPKKSQTPDLVQQVRKVLHSKHWGRVRYLMLTFPLRFSFETEPQRHWQPSSKHLKFKTHWTMNYTSLCWLDNSNSGNVMICERTVRYIMCRFDDRIRSTANIHSSFIGLPK